MNDQQRQTARKHLDELISQVPNFVERVRPDGDLRSMAISGAQAAVAQSRRNVDKPQMSPTYGILRQEAELVVDQFLEEMTGGRLGSRFVSPPEEPESQG